MILAFYVTMTNELTKHFSLDFYSKDLGSGSKTLPNVSNDIVLLEFAPSLLILILPFILHQTKLFWVIPA